MTLLHRYILKLLSANLVIATTTFIVLFLLFDFFDRIGNILREDDVELVLIFLYFFYKIPQILVWVLPIGMLIATLLTIGMLSKNSEFTAMRASGSSVLWLTKPVMWLALILSLFSLVVGETLVPHTQRRSREIYNIDIKQKDLRGSYSQTDFWWRDRNTFYSVDLFDSRENILHEVLAFSIDDSFRIREALKVAQASWLGAEFGWLGEGVTRYRFPVDGPETSEALIQAPLEINKIPRDFFHVKTDVRSLSYFDLKNFIDERERSGLEWGEYLVELHSKVAFPFVIFIVPLAVLPFAVRSARSGSLAGGFTAALAMGFSYYALHSLAIALGRAEFIPPLLAAWTANLSLVVVGVALNLGAEAPDS